MKKILILALPLLAAAIAAFVVTCGNSDTAFVTIDLNRPGKSYTHYRPGILQRLDAIFSTPAYAGGPTFPSVHGDLFLEVSAPDMRAITTDIPSDASSFTVEIPAGDQRRITVYSYSTEMVYDMGTPVGLFNDYNFGGHQTLNLSPGENVSVSITMQPMTKIISVTYVNETTCNIGYYDFGTSGTVNGTTNRYRSTNIDGPYSTTAVNTVTPGTTYYFRTSITLTVSGIEGEMSRPYKYTHTAP